MLGVLTSNDFIDLIIGLRHQIEFSMKLAISVSQTLY